MNIEELLIEFDEMGFAPTTLCENPEQYAKDWKNKLKDMIHVLQSDKEELRINNSNLEFHIGTLATENEKQKKIIYTLAILQNMGFKIEVTDIEDIKKFLSDLGLGII